ncbi:RrF2 family transcriptional regulator [Acidimangrovimonas sediminis]|uniref:RrF2 family transcriptional regulator n=1 Tax=Acidimangrovimonas sediminis TaxID=2056283 RepID=UPI000C808A70|nr:Rrf2 family transcriptional regulator [Acidimangrovimonas sediminis]
MRLNDTTDVALRVMIYAASVGDRRFTIDQVVEAYGVPRSTVMKVVNALTQGAFLTAQRGRSGGLNLSRAPEDIGVGAIVRRMETDFGLVECMRAGNACTITKCCRLISPLAEARKAFLDVLDTYSVADMALAPMDFGLSPS